MKIQLRNLKVNERLSDETPCFSATLYVDDRRVAAVVNRGTGGPCEYVWTDPAAEARLAEAGERLGFDFEPVDRIVYRALDRAETANVLRRWRRKGYGAFRLVGDDVRGYSTEEAARGRPGDPITPETYATLEVGE